MNITWISNLQLVQLLSHGSWPANPPGGKARWRARDGRNTPLKKCLQWQCLIYGMSLLMPPAAALSSSPWLLFACSCFGGSDGPGTFPPDRDGTKSPRLGFD